jgi:N-acetylmuramoyl-L-alanine amidase
LFRPAEDATSSLPTEGPFPLRAGATGPQVADLQARLEVAGHPVGDEPGTYGAKTAEAVRAFQCERGLHADGACDRHTWHAIVEAGYRLGDRLLYRRAPMLRGDDVAELQRRLSTFGFDPGRIDGIFGDRTAAALLDFQRNVGSAPDGVCGHRTVAELRRLALHHDRASLVTDIRDELRWRERTPGLAGRQIGVADAGGFAAGVAALCRALADAGAIPLALLHPDPSQQAAEANAAGVDCVVGFVLDPDQTGCTTSFYRGFRYESLASRRLAELVQQELPTVLSIDDAGTAGMALPILRETRMPAVEVRLGPPAAIVPRIAEVAQVLTRALSGWAGSPAASVPIAGHESPGDS